MSDEIFFGFHGVDIYTHPKSVANTCKDFFFICNYMLGNIVWTNAIVNNQARIYMKMQCLICSID